MSLNTQNRVVGIFIRVISAMNGMGAFWIFLIMCFMVSDVVGRICFNSPIIGTPEIVRLSLPGIVFLQIPHTIWMNKLIKTEMLTQKLNAKSRVFFDLAGNFLGAAVFIGIVISSWSDTLAAWKILEYEGEGALRVPTYPIRTIIIISSFLSAMIFFSRIFKNLNTSISKSEGAS